MAVAYRDVILFCGLERGVDEVVKSRDGAVKSSRGIQRTDTRERKQKRKKPTAPRILHPVS